MHPFGNAVTVVAAVLIGAVTLGCPLREPTPGGELSFLKEISSTQIARQGEDQILDCAAANFCKVTWYKDGAPLAGQRRVGRAITLPHLQDNDQYLVFKGADVTDSGEYACVVSNGDQEIRRNTHLVVLKKTYVGAPVFLGGDGDVSCKDQTVELGGPLRLACAFFVGDELLSQSSAGWLKVTKEGDMPVEFLPVKAEVEQDSRNGDVIVARLHIESVGKDDFGAWKVYVVNGLPTEVEVKVQRRPAADNLTSPGVAASGVESAHGSGQSGCPGRAGGAVTLLTILLVLTSSLLLTTLAIGLWWAHSFRKRLILSTKRDGQDTKNTPLPE